MLLPQKHFLTAPVVPDFWLLLNSQKKSPDSVKNRGFERCYYGWLTLVQGVVVHQSVDFGFYGSQVGGIVGIH